MNFSTIDSSIVANVSIQKSLEGSSVPLIGLLFSKSLPRLPEIGFSSTPGRQLNQAGKLDRSSTTFFNWGLLSGAMSDQVHWVNKAVDCNDCLCMMVLINKNDIAISFRMNRSAVSPAFKMSFPSKPCELYLVVDSHYIFGAYKRCMMIVRTYSQLLLWVRIAAGVDVQNLNDELDLPLCSFCMVNRIEILFLPCAHAMCCLPCKNEFVEIETEKRTLLGSNVKVDVECPLCRREIQSYENIEFSSPQCTLCGCSTLDAFAGGLDGCGCIIGCYEQAVKWRSSGKDCPICSKKLDKVIKIFLHSG